MKRYNRIVIGVMAFLMFMISVLGAVSTSIFELNFYTKTQEKYNVAEKMNISQEEVTEATTVALLYTKGTVKDLDYIVQSKEESFDLYSSQDKEHMIDVKNLYKGMYYVLVGSIIGLFVTIAILIFKRKEINVFGLTLIVNKVSMYTLIFVAMLALFAFVNFDQFWTMFHKVFFSNDLWLMNPNTDALVNLFPEGLFSDLVFRIIYKFVAIFGLVNISAFLYRAYSLREIKND